MTIRDFSVHVWFPIWRTEHARIKKPLCTVCVVPELLTLKPCSWCRSFLGSCKWSRTSWPMWAQMTLASAYLYDEEAPHQVHVSQCLEKVWATYFLRCLKVGVEVIGSRFFFYFFNKNKSQIEFMLFQQKDDQKLSCSPPTHWTWTLITHAFVQITYSWAS